MRWITSLLIVFAIVTVGTVGAHAEKPATKKPAADPAKPNLDKADELRKAKDLKGAVAEMRLAVAARERANGKLSTAVAELYLTIAIDQFGLGDFAGAEASLDADRKIREKLDPNDRELGAVYSSLSAVANQRGDIKAAIAWAEKAVAVAEKGFGPDHTNTASALGNLANAYSNAGDNDKAETTYLRAIAIHAKTKTENYATMTMYNGLAGVYANRGKYTDAEARYREAFAMLEKLDPKSRDLGFLMTNIGSTLTNQMKYDEARVTLERAIALDTAVLEPNHPNFAHTLKELAAVYSFLGDHKTAIAMFLRARKILVVGHGPDAVGVGLIDNNLGQTYSDVRESVLAIQHLDSALAIFRKQLGDKHPNIGYVSINLARQYYDLGNFKQARAYLEPALALFEKDGAQIPSYASAMSQLGAVEAAENHPAKAKALVESALALRIKSLGGNTMPVAQALSQLGDDYEDDGDLKIAGDYFTQALDALAKSTNPKHALRFELTSRKAKILWKQGDLAGAEVWFRKSLAEGEETLGPDNPRLADVIEHLTFLLAVQKRATDAIPLMRRAMVLRDRSLALRLTVGSEAQKLEGGSQVANELATVVTIQTEQLATSQDAARAALQLILRRKGRILDSMTDQLAALRDRADSRALVEDLTAARARLSAMIVRGPTADLAAYEAKSGELATKIESLEVEMSKRAGVLPDASYTLANIQATIPRDAALVELLRFVPQRPAAVKAAIVAARYVAYVIHTTGDVAWIDLGDVAPIDDAIARFRSAIADPHDATIADRARTLDRLVMQPLRPKLDDSRSIFIAPDGALNLVPFAALRDEHGKYLVENYQFTYLNSGRDMLRVAQAAASRGAPVFVGAPAYGDASGTRAGEYGGIEFTPLPGTAAELDKLHALVPHSDTLVGAGATESAIKKLVGPKILHIATHGFFLADEETRKLGTRGLVRVRVKATGELAPIGNPLLRSGLAFAGANGAKGGAAGAQPDEDGILTALEVSNLDLRGTRLVVLSACDTGVGEIHNGNGVFGLRRALVNAGSQTQVMSLWRVDDLATRDLMERYYKSVIAGGGRSSAMRDAQLAMLRMHPYYWASFIVSGDWRGLDGQAPVPPVRYQPHGCACQSGASPDGVAFLGGILWVVTRRRRRRPIVLNEG